MVDVESLSDGQLRTKLIEFGYPIMPITGTTRKLMQKKLKILMENKNDGRRSLGRYSSEEESDNDVSSTKRSTRRATMGAPSVRGVKPKDPTPEVRETTKHTTTTTTKRVQKTLQDEFDTGSDSEPEVIEMDTSFSPMSQLNFQTSTTKYSRPQTVTSSSHFSNSYSPSLSDKPVLSSRFTSPASDGALDRLNQIRSRLSLSTTNYEHNAAEEEKAETPFLSNFTKRLSQLSTVPKSEYNYKNDIIKEQDTNGASAYVRSLQGRQARYRDVNLPYYSLSNAGGRRNNLISVVLLGVFCLFFVCVAVMYYGMRNDGGGAVDRRPGYFIPRCGKDGPDAKPGVNCINDSDIDDAVNFMRFIKPELVKRAVSYGCKDAVVKPFLTEAEVINLRRTVDENDYISLVKQMENMEVLAFRNAEWGISMVRTDAGNDLSEEHVFEDMDSVVVYKRTHTVGLAVLNPDLPLRCRLYNKICAVFNSALVICGTFLTLYMLNMGYKYAKQHYKQNKDEVYDMVRRIVEVLESSGDGVDDFLVINHVRDMILPIKNRQTMEKIWKQAVKFINENESRVRTEVQVVQGEPFEVWRWLGNPNLNASPRSKTWQGQAFETQIGSVNSLPCSPTPCLKVRGMMDDSNDRNSQLIREAVLAKCAHQCHILHCSVDSVSKCVYLKCADQNDAAIAYRNLHGWWYSGHLVTVKYLRLERYMQRFPDAAVSGPPFLKSLTPSTDWSS